MSYQYYDAQGNNYVRPWNNDFTDAEKQELGIGEYRDPATYKMPTHYYNSVPMGREQHNSWPGSVEDILKRMQDEERLKQVGERFPFEVSPTNEPTGWDRWPERSGTTGDDTLIAHVNADGTAHDYREPGHGGIRTPGGEVNPHGRRGGINYPDGRAKYSPEEIFRKMKAGELDINSHKYDDRFWSPETQPGDGSSLTPEAQRLYDSIWS